MLNRNTLLANAAFLVIIASTHADDWPQWRGPKRDGVWRESGIVERFAGKELKHRWEAPIGSGYSGPTVAAGRVYVTDREVEPAQIERVLCFDEQTGKKLWDHTYDCPYVNIGYGAGPRASVTVDNGRAFALGAMGHLHCFDAAAGNLLWKKDLAKEYKIKMPIWGIAASPLVDGELVILHIGGQPDACIVALDKKSGAERWRGLADDASYSAPIITEQAGRRVLICWTGQHVAGLDPQSGEVLWKYHFPPRQVIIGIATPVIDRNRVFVSSFYDGSLLLKLPNDRLAAEKIWQRAGTDERNTDALHSIISTPYFRGDYIYGVDSYGELRCLRAADGERVWENLTATPKARWSTIHMVENHGRLWMFNERGELLIGKLSPQGFEELSRAKLIEPTTVQLSKRGGVSWSHPAFANRHVFARSDEKLVCASLEPGEN